MSAASNIPDPSASPAPRVNRFLRKVLRAFLRYDPTFCDMHDDPRARAAAEEYLRHIRQHLRDAFGERTLDVLDAGCQAGRLLIPLAEQGHRAIGIDASGMALARARRHARERGLSVRLHRGDIGRLRRWIRPESLDVVVCTEVLYLCRDHEAILRAFSDSLRPGGLLCVSHRPQAYYLAMAVADGREDLARELLRRDEGPTSEADYQNWQTAEQLRARYADLGLRVLQCVPVDHLEQRIAPLDAADVRDALQPFHVKDTLHRLPAYLLVVARKGTAA